MPNRQITEAGSGAPVNAVAALGQPEHLLQEPALPGFLDVLRIIPLEQVKRCIWGLLHGHDQRALRCTCRALRQLAEAGLMTYIESPGHSKPHKQADNAVRWSRLLWCCQHYRALRQLDLWCWSEEANALDGARFGEALRAASGSLRSLRLSPPGVVGQASGMAQHLFAALPNAPLLTYLQVSSCPHLTTADAAVLAGALRRLQHLEKYEHGRLMVVCETDAEVVSAAEDLACSISTLPALRELDLIPAAWSPRQGQAAFLKALLAPAQPFYQLQSLSLVILGARLLHIDPVFEPWSRALARGWMPQLRSLRLGVDAHNSCSPSVEAENGPMATRVMDHWCSSEDVWRGVPHLVQLILPGTALGCEGATRLAHRVLPLLPQLQVLNLDSTGIGIAGARALAAALPRLHNLHDLNLNFNCIKEDGARALVDALVGATQLQSLERLWLVACGVRVKDPDGLFGPTQDLSRACCEALRAAWATAPHLAAARLELGSRSK